MQEVGLEILKLKRLKISSAADLKDWLRKNADHPSRIMVVTNARAQSPDHVSRDEITQALADHGWTTGPRFTLNTHLLGHVIAKSG